ncbi:MAG: ImmA/IrrE family metallo-endopeptidase [Clostridiales bacterium]|nr:ImmA/IrrE family metallo-endopeptidase [Clostridiales bacterium]
MATMNMSCPINIDVLAWARKELNLSIDDVAIKMKKAPNVIESWEAGFSSPTYAQLEKLAYEIYKIPMAVFFFSEPPESSKVKVSFRTTPDTVYNRIPSSVLKVFREAEIMIDNLYELNEGRDSFSQGNSLKEITGADIPEVADNLRKYLGVSIAEQKSWRNSELALRVWREKVTDSGIFVFRNPFKEIEYSGFCLYDEHFPIIYINSSNSKNRQIFTIFHEFWHLLSHTSGIDFLHDNNAIEFYDKASRDIEIQCNKFAAEFLLPDAEFEMIISNHDADEKNVAAIATEFSVSRELVLRKFFDYKMIAQSDYDCLTSKWHEEMIANHKSNSGGSYYINEMSYLGEQYLRMAFDAYFSNNISSAQLAEYLNIKEKNLPEYEANYLRRAVI